MFPWGFARPESLYQNNHFFLLRSKNHELRGIAIIIVYAAKDHANVLQLRVPDLSLQSFASLKENFMALLFGKIVEAARAMGNAACGREFEICLKDRLK